MTKESKRGLLQKPYHAYSFVRGVSKHQSKPLTAVEDISLVL
jgi:hypothetical protein